jgi:hypothetical protein
MPWPRNCANGPRACWESEVNIFGGRCQGNAVFAHEAKRRLSSNDLRRKGAPLGQGSRASLLVDLPRDEMALLIELVVDLGVN